MISWSFAIWLVACAPTPATPRIGAPRVEEAPVREPTPACEGERVELEAGGWFTTATGLIVRFEGAQHDSYADGSTDLLLSLAFATETTASETWLPSAFATESAQTFLGHCVSIVEGAAQRVVLTVAPATEADAPPVCSAASTVPRLDDYARVTDGAHFHVEVRRDARTGEWLPIPLPKMPHHHASRLAWLDLPDHPGLAAVRSETLRFEIEVVSHTISPVGTEWRAEYRARVLEVCRTPPKR